MRFFKRSRIDIIGGDSHFRKYVKRFVNSTCLGSRGRNGRNIETPAMLNMLPKLALVAIKTYFMVFANVFLPSIIPWDKTPRSFSISMMSAVAFATSTALSTEMLTSASCRAKRHLFRHPYTQRRAPLF